MNPTYYGLEDNSKESLDFYLSTLIETILLDLQRSGCVEIEGGFFLEPTTFGRIASYYYLQHATLGLFGDRITQNYRAAGDAGKGEREDGDFHKILRCLCDASEFSELPVRHNEDIMNRDLEQQLPVKVMEVFDVEGFGGSSRSYTFESPHNKAFLLLQAHLQRLKPLPCSDYVTDTNSVMDQSVRILQAMIDVAADSGFLGTTIGITTVLQCIKQGLWLTDSTLLSVPYITQENFRSLRWNGAIIDCLPKLMERSGSELRALLSVARFSSSQISRMIDVVQNFPAYDCKWTFFGADKAPAKDFTLQCGVEYELRLEFERMRPFSGISSQGFKAFCPYFPKQQYESWFILLGIEKNDDLIALKRISMAGQSGSRSNNRSVSRVNFVAPEIPGSHHVTLFLISDAYVGLDRQWTVRYNVE